MNRKSFFILLAGFLISNFASAQIWTTNNPPPGNIFSFSSSADGNTLIAGFNEFGYAISTNMGVSWLTGREFTTPTAVSADGKIFYGHGISTNFGTTWNVLSNGDLFYICSADGSKLLTAKQVSPGQYALFTTPDFGNTWISNHISPSLWSAAAGSADGNKLFVANTSIYRTTNFGGTWTLTAAPFKVWTNMACSADGTKIIAASLDYLESRVWISTNSGDSWTSNSPYAVPAVSPFNPFWRFTAVSADGATFFAGNTNGFYSSTNNGLTWITNTTVWGKAVLSADSKKLSIVNGLALKTLQYTSPSQISLTASNGTYNFSWLVPSSTNFVLQQSFDLANWTTLTNSPSLNFTNLNEELSLAPTNDSGFFRLIGQ